ncbi:MAG: TPM domain-containing protein [Patescibacteria group bacterium]|nr:TPM domain-containing protein [Patescibacteria group bacterium]
MKFLRLSLLLVAFLSLQVAPAAALAVPPPPQTVPILDQAEVLTPDQEQALGQKIITEQKQTGNQVGVLTIPSLQGDVLEEYSLKVAREWGIGSKDRNSGVLLLVAVQDRQLRIEVGYGLEGALPDIRASQIINDRIKPSFRAGDYNAGINNGVDGILLAIHNEKDPNLQPDGVTHKKSGFPLEAIIFGLFIIPSWLGSILGRSKSWWAGGVLGALFGGVITLFVGLTLAGLAALVLLPLIGLLFDKSVSRNYQQRAGRGVAPSWWAGGSSIGGGKGGFGGFGGGGFGGGGSSGSW